jgi:predicted  nucleic acid-binding Zn-ribbon protein
MNYTKTLSEYEKELKEAKKKFDKLQKQYKKCRSAYQAEMIYDDLTILNEDIAELQLIVKDLRQQKKLAELDVF